MRAFSAVPFLEGGENTGIYLSPELWPGSRPAPHPCCSPLQLGRCSPQHLSGGKGSVREDTPVIHARPCLSTSWRTMGQWRPLVDKVAPSPQALRKVCLPAALGHRTPDPHQRLSFEMTSHSPPFPLPPSYLLIWSTRSGRELLLARSRMEPLQPPSGRPSLQGSRDLGFSPWAPACCFWAILLGAEPPCSILTPGMALLR